MKPTRLTLAAEQRRSHSLKMQSQAAQRWDLPTAEEDEEDVEAKLVRGRGTSGFSS